MILQRFEVPELAHYSYLIASEQQAIVIDPQRDISVYREFAAAKGLSITHILGRISMLITRPAHQR